jgi:hypothetical protein
MENYITKKSKSFRLDPECGGSQGDPLKAIARMTTAGLLMLAGE